jgi:hypothetical protein
VNKLSIRLLLALFVLPALALAAGTCVFGQTVEMVAATAKLSVAVILAREPNGIASGTGFLIATNRVLTAFHVVDEATRVLLKFPSTPSLEARVIQADRDADLAVLEIPDVSSIFPLPLGNISEVREGETVVVIGYPRVDALGTQTPTVTEGIVSAIRSDTLQIQAPVSPGNSGGPVLDLEGQVIGVVRSTLRGEQQAINFATAIDRAQQFLGLPPQPSALDYTVVLGDGIGGIHLGMKLSDVQALLGAPEHVLTGQDGKTSYSWYDVQDILHRGRHPRGGIAVRATRDGTITVVGGYFDRRYNVSGVHVGAPEDAARRAFGEPTETYQAQGTHTLLYATRQLLVIVGDDPNLYGYEQIIGIVVYLDQ